MQFPISRTSLQNYREEARRQNEIKSFNATIEYITQQLLSSATRGGMNGEKKLQIWAARFIEIPSDKYPQLVIKLKERFPDTDFQFDPMNTYLLIDWS